MGIKTLVLSFFLFLTHFPAFSLETEEELRSKIETDQASYDQYKGYIAEIQLNFAEQMKRDFNLNWCGEMNKLHRTVEEIGMKFEANRRASITEARGLILVAINRLLNLINSHEKIQPFLEEKPFTHQRVEIAISFNGHFGRNTDGTVSHVFNSPSRLTYFSKNPFLDDLEEIYEETYADAVKSYQESHIQDLTVHDSTDLEEAMDQTFELFEDEMRSTYGLRRWSIGGKLTNGIEEIGAKFIVLQPANQDEARQLVLRIVNRLVEIINNNEKLKPYLKEDPFSVDRIKMRFCFKDRDYNSYRDGTLNTVTLEGSEITYFQEPPVYGGPPLAQEKYEDASKIVDSTPAFPFKFKPRSQLLLWMDYLWAKLYGVFLHFLMLFYWTGQR